ncbi:hypothetical protein J3R83DRAFT_3677 [Lanmaoa asiatica]|nr:hypothetical protein J3R83DRAFT_3677 [Lanmaoa asiatica]
MSTPENYTSPSVVVEPQNALGLLDVPSTNDPPPPYPSPERRQRALRSSRRHPQRASAHISTRSTLSSLDPDALADHAVSPGLHPHLFPTSGGPSETTPLLRQTSGRHRANSHASTVVSSSSFTQTLLSFCHDSESEPDVDIFEALRGAPLSHQDPVGQHVEHARNALQCRPGRWSLYKRAWARYFRPMSRKAYHAAVFHLMVVNFPYALIAWIYLFVFTLTGTTLLITLPLGALLCFLDLLGARVFARGEVGISSLPHQTFVLISSQLALQTKFHGPLAYPPPYPPRPIFRRTRPAELSAAETGASGMQYETSFYKNAYAMVRPLIACLPLMLTRPPFSVHGCDDVPGIVLLSRDQAQYHSLHIDSVSGADSSVVRAHSARSPNASARP